MPLCNAVNPSLSSQAHVCRWVQDSGQIRTLHARVNSLKDQVTALTQKLDSQETALEAAYEQIAVRDGRVRALEMQVIRTTGLMLLEIITAAVSETLLLLSSGNGQLSPSALCLPP